MTITEYLAKHLKHFTLPANESELMYLVMRVYTDGRLNGIEMAFEKLAEVSTK